MDKVTPGMYVEMAYDLYEIDNGHEELMLSMTKERPECLVFGVEQNLVQALCDLIEGKQPGDKFDATLTPDKAFGKRNEEHVMTLGRDLFEVDGKFDQKHVYEGAVITMMTAEGFPVQGLVLKITPKDVTVDFNHPLAGKTVRFKGEILTVRPATERELHPSCGGCGGGCSEGSCDNGGCQGNCGGGCGN